MESEAIHIMFMMVWTFMSVMFGAVSGWLAHIFYLYIKSDKPQEVDNRKGQAKGKGHKPASNAGKQKAPVRDSKGEIWHRPWNDYDSDETEPILCEPCEPTPNEMEMNRGSGVRSRRGASGNGQPRDRMQSIPTPVKLYHTDANATKLHYNRFCTGLRKRDMTVPLKERETCKLCVKSVMIDPLVSMINE